MKYYIKYSLSLIGIVVILGTLFTYTLSIKNTEISRLSNNIQAIKLDNDSLASNGLVYRLKLEEMYLSQDSVIKELNKAKKALKIKDRELSRLQYIKSEAKRVDTIVVRDTIFKESTKVDTTFVDSVWYNINLKFMYPDTIIVSPKFTSEKIVVFSYKKQTIKPPKKCFLLRLFQRKHTVVSADIIEKNPYIHTTNSKFIDIVE